ncbi:exopolysaccharide production repressor protein exox [Georhizobium profundi]|jgi:exopolysaccharide production repressor protein|uniref:Exopolysaccharide production repressor protein exox n=1 Tax=Georhizobium profundi TaxID=2341112 RepID=A0A3Q8XQ26_9HYPH|nr:exopolysaccharide production repressor protein [Georhizobium profundi]AZN72620.1 exopolysaccharide production repressor protein exox [Georhizobium profundi]
MSFLLFFRGMIATLVVFAIATFALTQSAWTTFVSTAICAVTIQVGYFAAILFMVWRDSGKENEAAQRAEREGRTQHPSAADNTDSSSSRPIGTVTRPRH